MFSIISLVPFRVWAGAAIATALIAAVLAFGHRQYQKGGERVQAAWNADIAIRTAAALKASEAARATEQALNNKVAKVSNDYAKAKQDHANSVAASGDELRKLQAILARPDSSGTDTATSTGTDADPRLDIIAECSRAYVVVDAKARELADTLAALQKFSAVVRLTP